MNILLKQCVTALMALSLLCQSLAALSAPCPLLVLEGQELESKTKEVQATEQSKSPCHMAMVEAVDTTSVDQHLTCCGEDTCPMSKTMSAAVLLDSPQITSQSIRFIPLSLSTVQAPLAEHGNHLYRPPIAA